MQVALYSHTPFDARRPHAEGPASSHALLARAAARYTGRTPEAFSEPARGAYGKPVFSVTPPLCFSISHSGSLWLCAMAPREVGLDVQERRVQNTAGIARRFFHPLERAYLEARGPDAFFQVWTAKESVCKYRGTGIDGAFSRFSVTDGARLLPQVEELWLTWFSPCPGYDACLCTGEAAELTPRPF